MPAPLPHFVRLNGEIRGPFTPEQLGQLAEVGAITPDTEASTTAGGPSVRLEEFPACAALFPWRERPGSKAGSKTFEMVNGPTGQPVELRELVAIANRPPPSTDSMPVPMIPQSDEVVGILRDNERVQAQYEKPMDLARRPNRRLQDYLILMTVVNGFFVGAIILTRGSSIVLGFSIGGIAVFSSAITWTMFGVMNRY
jgi:hypothetical protein